MSQSTVSLQQGLGVVGEIFDNGPHRAQPFNLVSADASYNVFGRGFSKTSEGVAAAGNAAGIKIFAGILINPKAIPLFGTTLGTLQPSLTVPNNQIGELLTEGSVIVALAAAAAIGDLVVYDNTTGILATISPGAPLPVGKSFAHAFVDRYTVSGAGLAVITLINVPIEPVLA